MTKQHTIKQDKSPCISAGQGNPREEKESQDPAKESETSHCNEYHKNAKLTVITHMLKTGEGP